MPHVDEGTLHALLDGALRAEAPERAAAVETHLDGCADCRARLEAATDVRGRASDILARAGGESSGGGDSEGPAAAPAPDFSEVLARAEAGAETSADGSADGSVARLRRRWRWTRGAAWAATMVLALGTGYLIRDLAEPGVRPASTERAVPATENPLNLAPSLDAREGAEPESPESLDQAATSAPGAASSATPSEGSAEEEAAVSTGDAPSGTGLEAAARYAAPEPGVAEATGMADTGAAVGSANAVPLSEAVSRSGGVTPLTATGSEPMRWRRVTVEEARDSLAGPLYMLPRAEIREVYVAASGPRPAVMTLQRLATGIPVRVTQTRVEETQGGEDGAAAEEAAELRAADMHLPDAEVVHVRRGPFTLELSGTLPAELLRILAEAAGPAG